MSIVARLSTGTSPAKAPATHRIGLQTVAQGDCLAHLRSMPGESVDVVVTSPPYSIGIPYGAYDDRRPREAHLAWLAEIGAELHRIMAAGGSLLLNVGSTNADPWIATDVAGVFRPIFVLQNTIAWVKSVAIGEDTVGHFKPINSRRYLNNTHETIFRFTKEGRTELDRLAWASPSRTRATSPGGATRATSGARAMCGSSPAGRCAARPRSSTTPRASPWSFHGAASSCMGVRAPWCSTLSSGRGRRSWRRRSWAARASASSWTAPTPPPRSRAWRRRSDGEAASLVISKIDFDLAAIASALRISETEAQTALRDGRGAWPFSEIWGGRLYEFITHGTANMPFSDGAVALGQLRDATVSVKALTRAGVKVQQSKFVGSGRGTGKAGLIASIEASDRVVVVDVTEFPTVRFLPVDSTRLVGAAHTGRLTVGGWSKQRLHEWLGEIYDVSEASLSP